MTRIRHIEWKGAGASTHGPYLPDDEVREQHSFCLGKALSRIVAEIPVGGRRTDTERAEIGKFEILPGVKPSRR